MTVTCKLTSGSMLLLLLVQAKTASNSLRDTRGFCCSTPTTQLIGTRKKPSS
jgi:hypothetical protein